MAIYDGNVAIGVTSSKASIGNAWASVAASATNAYQLLGFSGGASRHAASVEVYIGGTLYLQGITVGKSGCAVSEWFGNLGPMASQGQGLIVRTWGQPGAGPCYANLMYRIVL